MLTQWLRYLAKGKVTLHHLSVGHDGAVAKHDHHGFPHAFSQFFNKRKQARSGSPFAPRWAQSHMVDCPPLVSDSKSNSRCFSDSTVSVSPVPLPPILLSPILLSKYLALKLESCTQTWQGLRTRRGPFIQTSMDDQSEPGNLIERRPAFGGHQAKECSDDG